MNEIHSNPQLLTLEEEIQFIKHIATGGEGTIHKAKWRGQIIVVKKPKDQNSLSLTRELHVYKTVFHPCVLNLLEQSPNLGWLLLPYMEKGDLKSLLLSREELFPWSQRLQLSCDVAEGLQFLHENGILHCDIKAENILIDGKYRAKLADFGIAQIKQHPEWGYPWGATVQYWSPELIPWMRRLKPSDLFMFFPERNKGELVGELPPFSEKNDVYALGTLFWEIAERRLALSEVHNGRRFRISEHVPLTYRIWIEWCRAQAPEKRPLCSTLFEELSNREIQHTLLEEADRRLALTTIILEEGTVFPDLFEKVHKIPNLEQLLFKIEPLQGDLSEYQKELQKEIDTLVHNFSLLKENTGTLKKWQLDCDSLIKNPKYWEEMTGEQRHQLQQLTCQYGYWVKRTEQPDTHWFTLEPILLKDRALQVGEIYLYSRSQSPHLIAFLQTTIPSERLEYARTIHLLSFFWETLQETLKTKTTCRFHEAAKKWFQMLSEMREQFSNSQDPFIQASLPLILQSSAGCMQFLISPIHERFVILLNDDKQSSIEAVSERLEKEFSFWFHHYLSFNKWEWIAQFQTQVLQPTLVSYLKKTEVETFEKIAHTLLLPWLKRYANHEELQPLIENAFDWIRELALENPQTRRFDSIEFKKQIVPEKVLQVKIQPWTPPLWQALNQKREGYTNCTDYTQEVIQSLDTALKFCLPFLGEAPTPWTLLGLGSLGRGQLLPYSDLDIALLIENEEMRSHLYWQRLIHMLETLTQVMDSAGYWDQESESYLFLGHHIDGGDKKAMQSKKPLFIQTPQSFARWAAQTLHKVTKEDKVKSTTERLLAYSCLHTCVITGTGQGLFPNFQMELKRELKGNTDHLSMVLAWQNEHGKDWERALRLDHIKKKLISLKDSVFAPLNYYLLDHALLNLDKVENNDWLELMQVARQKAFQLRLTLEQRAKGRILSVKKAGNEQHFPKLFPFENALTLTEEEHLLLEQLQGLGAVAYNAIFNSHNTTHPLHVKGISLGEIHPTVQEYWAIGIAATLTFGKESDLKIHRRLYRLMSGHTRFEYEDALKRFSKVAPQAEYLLKKILRHVPLSNGNRGSFLPRQEKWQKIIMSLIEPCDPKNIPKETSGVLISWVENLQTRHGILKKEFAEQLLDKNGQFCQEKKLKDGRRSVIPLCNKNKKVIIYPKAYPELPGRQLAADCLAYRITGSSVQASLVLFTPLNKGQLNEKTSYPVLLSKPAGQTIQNTIRNQKRLTKLSLYHFTLKVLATYILGYEDDKKDNVTLQLTVDEMGNPCWQLVSIDSDHVFSTPMIDTTIDSKILLKTVTFTFPEMIKHLDPEAVADFLSLNKDQVLEQWLGECRLLNSSLIGNLKQNRQGLFSPQLIQRCAPLDSWFSTNKSSYIPIAFEPGTISDIYQRWRGLEQALKAKKPPSTHFDLLQQMAPRLGQRYQQIFNDYPTVGKRFDALAELHTDYKVTKEKGTNEKEEISHTSTLQLNVSKTLVGVKKFQEALMQGKIFDASGSHGGKELEEIQTHYQYLNELKKVFEVGLDADEKDHQAVIQTLEILLAKPHYSALIERVLAGIRFHYTEKNTERLLSFQYRLLNLLWSQKSLQKLTFIGWRALTEDIFLELIKKSSDLQHLSIIDCPNFKCSGKTWEKLSFTCPQLKSIRMSQVAEIPLFARLMLGQKEWFVFEELELLYLQDCPELTVYQIIAPKLQQLILKNCNKLIEVNLRGQSIQNLRLHNCTELSDEGFLHNAQGKHLQKLSIYKCPKIKWKDTYQKWPFLLGLSGIHYRDDERKELALFMDELQLKPHEISSAVTWILEQCERVRQCRNYLKSITLEIEKLLLSWMKDTNFFVRKNCIKSFDMLYPFLPQEKQKKVLEALLFGLQDEDSRIGISCAKALGKLYPFLPQEKQKKVLEALLSGLQDENSRIRITCAEALSVLYHSVPQEKQKEILEALLSGLQDENSRIRITCAEALSVLYHSVPQEKQKEILERLLSGLKDHESSVRSACAKALHVLYPSLSKEEKKEKLERMLPGLKDNDIDVCRTCANTLDVFYFSLLKHKQIALEHKQIAAFYKALLFGLKYNESKGRIVCAETLGVLKSLMSQEMRKEVAEELLSGFLKYSDIDVGSTYAKILNVFYSSLSQEKQKVALEALLSRLKDKYLKIRIICAKVLKARYPSLPQEKQKVVVEALLSGLQDEDSRIRITCAKALSVLYPFLPQEKQKVALETLLSWVNLKDEFFRFPLVKALGKLYPSLPQEKQMQVLEGLLSGMKDEEWEVRIAYAEALGKLYPSLPQEKQMQVLEGLLSGMKYAEGVVRSACAGHLRMLYPSLPQKEQKMVLEVLLSMMKDEERAVRRSCERYLRMLYPSLPQEEQKMVLEVLLSGLNDKDRFVRSDCAKAICELSPLLPQEKQNEALHSLMNFLASESLWDPDHHKDFTKNFGVFYPSLPQKEQKATLETLLNLLHSCYPKIVREGAAKALTSILKNLSIAHYLEGQMPALRKLLDKLPPPQDSQTSINNKTIPSYLEDMLEENSLKTVEGNNERSEKKRELKTNPKEPIWYSNSELEKLLNLQLSLEKENSNSGTHLWAEAASVQNLEMQLMYAASVQSKDKPIISLIPLFLNAKENDFHQVGNHWTVLILVSIPNQNENPRHVAIYQNPMGLEIPNSIKSQLKDWEIFDLQIKQQANDNDCGPWVVYTAQRLVETLVESFPLLPSKEGLQKWITALRENQEDELRLFYQKQLFEEQQSNSKVMSENFLQSSLLSIQSEQVDDGKEDIEN